MFNLEEKETEITKSSKTDIFTVQIKIDRALNSSLCGKEEKKIFFFKN
jgi:hypothetical protein